MFLYLCVSTKCNPEMKPVIEASVAGRERSSASGTESAPIVVRRERPRAAWCLVPAQ